MRISTIKHAAWLAATAFILASCGVATHENGPLRVRMRTTAGDIVVELDDRAPRHRDNFAGLRSEEHTSELQSQSTSSYAVFCLKKKRRSLPVRRQITPGLLR